MSLDNFDALVKLLGDKVGTNVAMSNIRREEAIYSEMTIVIGIRVLTGSSYDDILNTYGISKTGFYTARNKFLNAVLNCGELDISLSTKASKWEKVQKGFASKSSSPVLTGCVDAIDGFFQPTKCLMVAESCGFPHSYFSGHYQPYGLNCQAICDSRLRFLFFSVIAPGQTNDAVAYEQTLLHEIIENFAAGAFIAGGTAYMLTENLLVPFTGSCKQDPDKNSYNFYLSHN
jgi:hypothetical protein